jgi:hypothetical protein
MVHNSHDDKFLAIRLHDSEKVQSCRAPRILLSKSKGTGYG